VIGLVLSRVAYEFGALEVPAPVLDSAPQVIVGTSVGAPALELGARRLAVIGRLAGETYRRYSAGARGLQREEPWAA
jgi:DNA-binding IclR family transcriptional regulator